MATMADPWMRMQMSREKDGVGDIPFSSPGLLQQSPTHGPGLGLITPPPGSHPSPNSRRRSTVSSRQAAVHQVHGTDVDLKLFVIENSPLLRILRQYPDMDQQVETL